MVDCPSLLITDDDRGFRETLGGAFAERGFRTHLAADGVEAVEIVSREEIHLVLLDMHMPRLTGLQALRQMRLLHAEMPCILISGGLDERVLAEAEQAAVYSVLSKPIQFQEVTQTVRNALRELYGWG